MLTLEYIHEYVEFVLNKGISSAFDSFMHGFYSVCRSNAFALFDSKEVMLLVQGNEEINLDSLKVVAEYRNIQPDSLFIQ